MFQTKGNSNFKRTQYFNEIYEKSTNSFVGLIPVFSDLFYHLLLFQNSVLCIAIIAQFNCFVISF